MFDWHVLCSFVGYLALMLTIGFLFSKRQESLGDYYLGGRKMNKWVVALSAQASDMSGWLLMGLPGAIFVGGFSEAWIGVGLLIGTYLNWKIIAERLRRFSQAYGDAITIPDFISNRFCDKSGIARIVAAIIILVFFTLMERQIDFTTLQGEVLVKLLEIILSMQAIKQACILTTKEFKLDGKKGLTITPTHAIIKKKQRGK
jgi:Na+/proline symporter